MHDELGVYLSNHKLTSVFHNLTQLHTVQRINYSLFPTTVGFKSSLFVFRHLMTFLAGIYIAQLIHSRYFVHRFVLRISQERYRLN